ncbi:mechanosensitive ion channel [Lacinutrix algicola]|uniref:mechanosensitive ion channel n=1 Tax=Lacinutrix algicola TaxID=342954 RepID=UPI0006E1D544|nr:mechanosensitive ion channel [Lacinutrix algicola]
MDFLNNIQNSLSSSLGGNLTNAIAALLILIIGIFVAKFVKKIITKLIAKIGIDSKLKSDKVILSNLIGKIIYFLLMIIVFMLALEKLGMTNVLEPLKIMLNKFLGFIPNIIGAGLVAYIGYMLANVVSEFVGLSGDTIQKFVPKFKLPENLNLVKILKQVVFILIFIPLLISALNILNIETISKPATLMLTTFFAAIPKILLAALILIVFVVAAKFISSLLKDLLNGMNLDNTIEKMNLNSLFGNTNIANAVSKIAYTFIVLFGLVTALEKLEFSQLTNIIDTVISYGGKVLFGIVIIAIGMWLANLLTSTIAKGNSVFVTSIVKIAIIAIFLAIGLRSMGIADEIVNLAFGITLGTVALTIVLSFGLGGREAAGKQMSNILEKFNKK